MASARAHTHLLIIVFSFLSCLLSCNCLCAASELRDGFGKVKGLFVFGDSLVDNGNNNFLQTLAKVNYTPYGIDFPLGPTGRFTNGKNLIDLLGDRLRLPLIPPFNDPATKGNEILHGVDYASGSSGILDDTGVALAGQVINLNQQVKNFIEVTLPDLEAKLGCSSHQLLANYLIIFNTGGNDYIQNYFRRDPHSINATSLEDFTDTLINSLYHHIKKIYELGGRKFVLNAIYPSGCVPVILASQSRGQCSDIQNHAARLFNHRLKQLVDTARSHLPGSVLVFFNSYRIVLDIINNPSSRGFIDARNPCCEVMGQGIVCKRGGGVCRNRSSYVFFDGIHSTEAVNVVLADKAYSSDAKSQVYPINIHQLALI
ncbi:GDSL lipase/esterase [Dillenia turbinata]|uniref:GDSL lipase/esterase n=1 Tax=Dillenia turbinata TaxID=194707 RepID=A0AAN8VT84_9MAGN